MKNDGSGSLCLWSLKIVRRDKIRDMMNKRIFPILILCAFLATLSFGDKFVAAYNTTWAENEIRIEGEHIIIIFDRRELENWAGTTEGIPRYPDSPSGYVGRAENYVFYLDQAYELLENLFNNVPYDGEKIKIVYEPSCGGGGLSGNPITIGRYPPSAEEYADWGCGCGKPLVCDLRVYFHELAHDFTIWTWPVELFCEPFAELGQIYVGKHLGGDFPSHHTVELAENIYKGRMEEYEQAGCPFSENEVPLLICGILLKLPDLYGWEIYSRMSKPDPDIYLCPPTNIVEQVNYFIYLLRPAIGEEVVDVFENWNFPLNVDSDNDNLTDGYEIRTLTTHFLKSDSDDDNLLDGLENTYGTDPAVADTDNDNLGDGFEVNGWNITVNGQTMAVTSSPLSRDTDRDNLSDGEEHAHGTDPNTSDTDGDGVSDWAEINLYGTSPTIAEQSTGETEQPTGGLPLGIIAGIIVLLIVCGLVGVLAWQKGRR